MMENIKATDLEFAVVDRKDLNKSAASIVNRLGNIDKDIQQWLINSLINTEVNRQNDVVNALFIALHNRFGNRAPTRSNAIHEFVQTYFNVEICDIRLDNGNIVQRDNKGKLPNGVKNTDVIKGYRMKKIRDKWSGRFPVTTSDNTTEWQTVTFDNFNRFIDRVKEIDWKTFQPERGVKDFNAETLVNSLFTRAVNADKLDDLLKAIEKKQAELNAA